MESLMDYTEQAIAGVCFVLINKNAGVSLLEDHKLIIDWIACKTNISESLVKNQSLMQARTFSYWFAWTSFHFSVQ
jgi:hypothetical protein